MTSLVSRLRDPVSGLTHLGGLLLAVAGLLVGLGPASSSPGRLPLLAFAVYGASLIGLYLASSLYHLLPLAERGVRALKRFDHIMVFFLIAGSYTPFCLIPLRGPWGYTLLAVAWGLALAGTVFKLCWLSAPRWLVVGLYLAMGWVVVSAIVPLARTMPWPGVVLLFVGGLFYSGGAVIYALRRPDPWPKVFGFHEIWHLFVLAGSIAHFWAVLGYVLPLA